MDKEKLLNSLRGTLDIAIPFLAFYHPALLDKGVLKEYMDWEYLFYEYTENGMPGIDMNEYRNWKKETRIKLTTIVESIK